MVVTSGKHNQLMVNIDLQIINTFTDHLKNTKKHEGK